jgi:hypothetical protein
MRRSASDYLGHIFMQRTSPQIDSDIRSETELEPLFRVLIHNNVNAENL